jgi:hypothetical protein
VRAVIADATTFNHGETIMTNFKVLAMAVLVSMAASPVFAQAAIQEPGNFAFFHPNADVLNAGVPTNSYASIPSAQGSIHAAVRKAGTRQHVAPPVRYDETPSYSDPSQFGGSTALPIH